jgi:allantoin racemase
MAQTARILVINPNASARVTQVIDSELMSLRATCPFSLDVLQNIDGPPGIALQADVDQVAPQVLGIISKEKADAYVIACFSDPGLMASRERFPDAVIVGSGEAAILEALTRGDRFGIISLSDASSLRQRRMVRMMGLTERYAGSQGIEATAEQSTSPELFEKMVSAGSALAQSGANVIAMGCAGMAHFRPMLQDRLGLPVIDPTGAALAVAIGRCMVRRGRPDAHPG